ncbi:MAG: hypothetical protein JSS32_00425 [Verrucomicrobia bacterium]|nr:hypothetical protein [Verrucomicrobiota bacterium]
MSSRAVERSSVHRVNEVAVHRKKLCCTDVKVQRAWLIAAATLCLVGAVAMGVLAFVASPWFAVGSVALAAGAGVMIWYACSLIDYTNPKEVARAQDRAGKMPLAEVIKRHGWDNLIRHKILTPEQFKDACEKHVEMMPFSETVDFYEEANGKVRSIPASEEYLLSGNESWKEKLSRETGGFEYRPLMAFPWDRLIKYGLVTPVELKTSFEAFAAVSTMNEIVDEYAKTNPVVSQSEGYELPHPIQWREKVAAETDGLKFVSVLEEFSLHRLINYGLLTPDELKCSFERFADTGSMQGVIEAHDAVTDEIAGYPAYSLPALIRWKGRFVKETEGLKFDKLFPVVERLVHHRILTPEELEQSFTAWAHSSTLNQIINRYATVQLWLGRYQSFSVPHPVVWKDKLALETNGLEYMALRNNYSIPQLIECQLLDSAPLSQSFSFYARNQQIMWIINEYERMRGLLRRYPGFALPHPQEFRDKFPVESRNLKCREIASQYNLEKLVNYNIIPQAEYDIIRQVTVVRQQYQRVIQDSENAYDAAVASANRVKNLAHQEADKEYENHPIHQEIRNLNHQKSLALAQLDREIHEQIRLNSEHFETQKRQIESSIQKLRDEMREKAEQGTSVSGFESQLLSLGTILHSEAQQRERSLMQIRSNAQVQKSKIEGLYDQSIQRSESTLRLVEIERARIKDRSDEWCARTIQEHRRQTDRLRLQSSELLEIGLAAQDRAYDQYRNVEGAA